LIESSGLRRPEKVLTGGREEGGDDDVQWQEKGRRGRGRVQVGRLQASTTRSSQSVSQRQAPVVRKSEGNEELFSLSLHSIRQKRWN
jgi:hypothetical protein